MLSTCGGGGKGFKQSPHCGLGQLDRKGIFSCLVSTDKCVKYFLS